MTPEQTFGRWMRISAWLYGAGGLAFAVLPGLSHELPAAVARQLLGWVDWTPMPPTASYSWHALAVSMMATIAVCSWFAGRDPLRNRDFAVPVMFSKGVSSLVGGLALFLHAPMAIYLVLVLTDFPLLVVTWLLWRRVPPAADRT